jgi:glutaredoxin/glutathione-dependent peroxiredoxin
MAVAQGDTIPDVEVQTMGPDGPQTIRTGEVLGTGKVALFAVPGAFTPGCSKIHLPGYVQGADELKTRGVDLIACVSVNDAWVMDAWAKDQGVGDKILMIADGSATFTKAMGLESDRTAFGLGVRSERSSGLIEDGVVTSLDVEPAPGVDVSSCTAMLGRV